VSDTSAGSNLVSERVAARPAPLWAVQPLVFVNSLGTGAVTVGIFFLTRHGHGYSTTANYALGLFFGLTYVAAAVGIGPVMRRAQRRRPGLTARRILAGVLGLTFASCMIPVAARQVSEPVASASWWLFAGLYAPLTGALWPITESYLSGGRHGKRLHAAIGQFNVVWAGAMIVAFWAMAPLVKGHPSLVIAALGVSHLLSGLSLVWFPAEPAPHEEGDAGPMPEHYPALLGVFRMLLPTSYLCIKALTPYLPAAMDRIGLEPQWQTPLNSTLVTAQTLGFVVLERWSGWHGRWAAPIAGGALLALGFGLSVFAPVIARGAAGAVLLGAGLAAFGFAAAMVYAGGIYYAMIVGRTRVDAGGTHEALIGLGNAAGPLCGLMVAGAVDLRLLPPAALEVGVVGMVLVVAVLVLGASLRRIRRHARPRAA